jgi:pimeloyl-ACP methyl ester carboxylesterase
VNATPPSPVELLTPDGFTLRGLRWGNGPDWLILAHDSDGETDLDAWRPLIPSLAHGDRSVLALDLRGHGASDGDPDRAATQTDLTAALNLAATSGAEWIAVLATGRSAAEALALAADTPLGALVLISPRLSDVDPIHTLRGSGESKLFAAGSEDQQMRQTVSQLRNRSIGWAMTVHLPTTVQGTDLLTGRYAGQLTDRIVTFLAEQRAIARSRRGRITPHV